MAVQYAKTNKPDTDNGYWVGNNYVFVTPQATKNDVAKNAIFQTFVMGKVVTVRVWGKPSHNGVVRVDTLDTMDNTGDGVTYVLRRTSRKQSVVSLRIVGDDLCYVTTMGGVFPVYHPESYDGKAVHTTKQNM